MLRACDTLSSPRQAKWRKRPLHICRCVPEHRPRPGRPTGPPRVIFRPTPAGAVPIPGRSHPPRKRHNLRRRTGCSVQPVWDPHGRNRIPEPPTRHGGRQRRSGLAFARCFQSTVLKTEYRRQRFFRYPGSALSAPRRLGEACRAACGCVKSRSGRIGGTIFLARQRALYFPALTAPEAD